MSWRAILTVLCFSFLFSIAQAQTCTPIPASYTLTDLGTLGGRNTYAYAVNSSGWVTGGSELTPLGTTDAFLWTPSTGMQDLGNLGGMYTYGFGVNSAGDVTGESDASSGGYHAFLWTSLAGMQDLGVLYGGSESFSVGQAIDDHDRVVGWEDASRGLRALLFANGKTYDLEKQVGESFVTARGINNKGQVVGSSEFDAVIWTKVNGLTHLGTLHQSSATSGFAMNPSGTIIAGDDLYQGNIFTAIAWILDPASGTYVLNNLGAGQAYGVNDGCQVVGESGFLRAFVWTPMDGREDLNTLIPPNSGLVLHWAFGINNAGQIVGQAIDSQGNTHGYLLTPAQ